jgi:hypothetical protein
MKILMLLILCFLTSCSYNIDNSVGGNITTSGNTFRNSSPAITASPFYIRTPNPAAVAYYCYTPPYYPYGYYSGWFGFRGWWW